MKEVNIKDVNVWKREYDGKFCSLEIIWENDPKDFVEEFNFMELENYNITSEKQFSKIDKMLKDYCFTTAERDAVIYLLATKGEEND